MYVAVESCLGMAQRPLRTRARSLEQGNAGGTGRRNRERVRGSKLQRQGARNPCVRLTLEMNVLLAQRGTQTEEAMDGRRAAAPCAPMSHGHEDRTLTQQPAGAAQRNAASRGKAGASALHAPTHAASKQASLHAINQAIKPPRLWCCCCRCHCRRSTSFVSIRRRFYTTHDRLSSFARSLPWVLLRSRTGAASLWSDAAPGFLAFWLFFRASPGGPDHGPLRTVPLEARMRTAPGVDDGRPSRDSNGAMDGSSPEASNGDGAVGPAQRLCGRV